uniref:Bax inhibitor 1 n=1 Tax=Percolomonas cosmopolitus TaxID=63605 RepID=A0A7S1KMD1_9EUKA|eukprot:CAMPEP_0117448272 /NCGR_PEP_ID=MMETSP0759-20121206/7314_1 /TAXON_ID=63605 /ORGANISM="Percolomonas cosmopolitus, Strain WS" /LENGTH=247 /DNA_ID=CAMNT_0005240651 /DNA_START=17 /DNA_END=760 /DNA_ORIENTATION=+
MSSFSSIFSSVPQPTKALLSFEHISSKTQQHLKKTYTTLLLFALAATVGCLVQQYFHIQSFLGTVLGFVLLFVFIGGKFSGASSETQMWTLCGFTFCQGISIGPLVEMTMHLDPMLPFYALSSTAILFGCFSLFALLSKRREYLYLGGICSSVLGIFFWMSLLNMFFRSSAMAMVELYGGLLLFSAYVVYDTQMIIEKAELGSGDHVSHAFELFLDAFSLFVRILLILARNKQKKDEEGKKKRRPRY